MGTMLLDACVTLNLLASEIPLTDIGLRSGHDLAMVAPAADEVRYLLDETGRRMVPVNVREPAHHAVLAIIALDAEETRRFVRFAEELDDGEAASLAVATHRGWSIATDDRKARRVASAHDANLEIVSTSTLIRCWAESTSVPRGTIRTALRRIETRATFAPPRHDENRSWWADQCA